MSFGFFWELQNFSRQKNRSVIIPNFVVGVGRQEMCKLLYENSTKKSTHAHAADG